MPLGPWSPINEKASFGSEFGAGEFALDNLSDEVTPWAQTGYRFVKRQSQEDPNIWVALGEPTEAPLYTAR